MAAMVSPGKKSGARGGRPNGCGDERPARRGGRPGQSGSEQRSARPTARPVRVMTLLRAHWHGCPWRREGRGINPARDKRTIGLGDYIGSRLREALLLRAPRRRTMKIPSTQSEPMRLNMKPSSRATFSPGAGRHGERSKALSVKAFLP